MAFYANGEIKPAIPRIWARRDHLEFSHENAWKLAASNDEYDQALGKLVKQAVSDAAAGLEGTTQQVFLLSPADRAETIKLQRPVRNTFRDRNGRPCAWTQGQRYTRLAALRPAPETTDELDSYDR